MTMTIFRAAARSADSGGRILIVGGGHAGLLLALGLTHIGIQVRVVEARAPAAAQQPSRDGRALALMQGSKQVFDALDIWSRVASIAEPVWGVRVEDQGTGATIAYDAREVGTAPFGYGFDNRLLQQRLLDLALAQPGIDIVAPDSLAAIERRGDRITAVLASGRRLACELLVGADGRGSTVRALARIGSSHRAYRQTAITFTVHHRHSHDQWVREYLRSAGPLALLPLGENRSAVTWLERQAVAEDLLRHGPEALLDGLRERIGDELGITALVSGPAGYPLAGHMAARYVAPRVALVGDAAHGIHPIHAQGFNLGVRDVATLTEVLFEADRIGLDLGGGEVLMRYNRWRRGDTRFVAGLTDGLNHLFSTDLVPAQLVRSAALTALDQVAPLKRLAMRRGMGLTGDLPRLARGEALR